MVARVFDIISASPVTGQLEIWMTGLLKTYEILDIKMTKCILDNGRLRTMVVAVCRERELSKMPSGFHGFQSLVDAHDTE